MERSIILFPRVALRLCLIFALSMVMGACYYQGPYTSDAWNLTDRQLDSISFYTTHHFTQNFNFLVRTDSLPLIIQHPTEYVNGLEVDTIKVFHGDCIVVADITTMPTDSVDSVWVKLARDEQTQGWIHESALLPGVSPRAPISQFIDFFSDTHLLIFMAFLVLVLAVFVFRRLMKLGAKIVHFNDISTFYPTLLCLVVSASAVFYSTIQIVNPESWRHYYYHPTLNPFAVPTHIGFFLVSVWLIAIVGIAAFDDVRRRLSMGEAFFYFMGLAGMCAVDYVVFSVSTLYYIGYPLFLAYAIFAIHVYNRRSRIRYYCGNCGAELHKKGICPKCGTKNE